MKNEIRHEQIIVKKNVEYSDGLECNCQACVYRRKSKNIKDSKIKNDDKNKCYREDQKLDD